MHCVLLGVTKKLIQIYLGKDNVIKCKHKLSKIAINEINDVYTKLTKYIPYFLCAKSK